MIFSAVLWISCIKIPFLSSLLTFLSLKNKSGTFASSAASKNNVLYGGQDITQEVLKKIQAEGDVTTDSSSTDTAAPAADASADSAASTADGSAPAESADNTAATDANAAQ